MRHESRRASRVLVRVHHLAVVKQELGNLKLFVEDETPKLPLCVADELDLRRAQHRGHSRNRGSGADDGKGTCMLVPSDDQNDDDSRGGGKRRKKSDPVPTIVVHDSYFGSGGFN